MLAPKRPTDQPLEQPTGQFGVPTSQYSFDQLAEIYNQARTDYIVPMPMNGKRMQEYVHNYDVDLDLSLVAVDEEDHLPNGICMVGIRDHRAWITRLGVIPERRRRHTGQYLIVKILSEALRRGKDLGVLEVIKGNDPAYRLFLKLGFEVTRELIISRRPPGPLKPELVAGSSATITEIPPEEIARTLEEREPGPAWVEETVSLLNTGGLAGIRATLPDGRSGWLIYTRTSFQITHVVLSPAAPPEVWKALLVAMHSRHPMHDTKLENIPVGHATWPILEEFGYLESFRRIEMLCDLGAHFSG